LGGPADDACVRHPEIDTLGITGDARVLGINMDHLADGCRWRRRAGAIELLFEIHGPNEFGIDRNFIPFVAGSGGVWGHSCLHVFTGTVEVAIEDYFRSCGVGCRGRPDRIIRLVGRGGNAPRIRPEGERVNFPMRRAGDSRVYRNSNFSPVVNFVFFNDGVCRIGLRLDVVGECKSGIRGHSRRI